MLAELENSITIISEQTQANLPILGYIALLPTLVFLVNTLLQNRLFILGIFPRHIWGLVGIIFSPFLHADFNHLFFNLVPLIVLANFILINGLDLFLVVTAVIMLISGFLIWCFGKSGVHIGASAVVTGYWAYLVGNIYQQGTVTAIILGIVCLYYFFGIFLGIFPAKRGVSWEGHLFGLMAGGAVSYCLPLFLAWSF
jgi:membrane associated rhomboid family serine protease